LRRHPPFEFELPLDQRTPMRPRMNITTTTRPMR
jgi:hypothetical protein